MLEFEWKYLLQEHSDQQAEEQVNISQALDRSLFNTKVTAVRRSPEIHSSAVEILCFGWVYLSSRNYILELVENVPNSIRKITLDLNKVTYKEGENLNLFKQQGQSIAFFS